MIVNEIQFGTNGKVVFQNGKLRMQYGTAPAWTDYITIDSAGLITLPTATAAASGLKIGTAGAMWDDAGTLRMPALILAARIASTLGEGTGMDISVISGTVQLQSGNNARLKVDDTGVRVIGVYTEFDEMTAPAAPGADKARLYVDVSGAKSRLMVLFQSGAAIQLAIEP